MASKSSWAVSTMTFTATTCGKRKSSILCEVGRRKLLQLRADVACIWIYRPHRHDQRPFRLSLWLSHPFRFFRQHCPSLGHPTFCTHRQPRPAHFSSSASHPSRRSSWFRLATSEAGLGTFRRASSCRRSRSFSDYLGRRECSGALLWTLLESCVHCRLHRFATSCLAIEELSQPSSSRLYRKSPLS
jgi:hypothetical protein